MRREEHLILLNKARRVMRWAGYLAGGLVCLLGSGSVCNWRAGNSARSRLSAGTGRLKRRLRPRLAALQGDATQIDSLLPPHAPGCIGTRCSRAAHQQSDGGGAPPFVLAGHSMGGLNVRMYASLYRAEVAGMVLAYLKCPGTKSGRTRPPRATARGETNFEAS
jgi:hypothetical protein